MLSKELRKLFIVSLLLIYAHGIEEVINGFQNYDSFMILFAKYFNTTPQFFYWVSHIVWWVSIPLLFILFKSSPLGLPLMTIFGLVFVIELHHVIKGLAIGGYYPGMITALFYPIMGLFFWKQLIQDLRKYYAKSTR